MIVDSSDNSEHECDEDQWTLIDEWTASSSSSSSLPSIDPDVRMMRRCTLELSMVPVSTLLHRIFNFMRLQSIPCKFHASDSVVRVNAFGGGSSLRFAVFLWRWSTTTDNKIVVEVQRRRGCAIEMQYVRRALFRALSSDQESTSAAPLVRKYQFKIPLLFFSKKLVEKCSSEKRAALQSIGNGSGHDVDDDNESYYYTQGAAKCNNLLSSAKSTDCNRLGLESLCHLLSDHDNKTVTETANEVVVAVAHALVYDRCVSPDADAASLLREAVLRFVKHQEDGASSAQTPGYHGLHVLALKVLTKAFRVIARHNLRTVPLSSAAADCNVIDLASDFWRTVTDSCRRDIADATRRPCIAALSIELLIRLLEMLPPIQARAFVNDDDEVMIDLLKAYSFGKLHHLGLEQKSRDLIDFLQ